MSRVALIGTLDTKSAEIGYLCEQLEELGVEPLVIDVGVQGTPGISAGVSREEIATLAGTSLETLREAGDRGKAVEAMMRGLVLKVKMLHTDASIDGVLAIGGSAGTTIATAAMRALPSGVPKLMVSTLASGNVEPYVGTKDLCMMYSITDFAGLNRLSCRILSNAAAAIAGMAKHLAVAPPPASVRTLLGATMFGVTTPCIEKVRALLEKENNEILVFHTTGTGGRAMEELIEDGSIEGVLDITTTELADELVGGVLSAGPQRMESAGAKGIPQVISVGALDMVNFGAPDTIPQKFKTRLFYRHNPTVTLMRTTPEESKKLGEIIARKASAATGPVAIVLPLKGVSAIDVEGKVFHDAAADAALFDAIRDNVGAKVHLIEVDAHINDDAFAEAIADAYRSLKT